MSDELPSLGEIAGLPRWARVAFAARCASRVLPLFRHRQPDTSDGHAQAVASAVKVSERAAANAVRPDHPPPTTPFAEPSVIERFKAAKTALKGSYNSPIDDLSLGHPSDVYAERTANYAVLTAIIHDHHIGDNVGIIGNTHHFRYVLRAAHAAVLAGAPISNILKDFQTLRERAKAGGWTDETPVPPSVFGPMWPEGPPPGWPRDPEADILRLRIAIPDDATEDDVKRMVRELAGAMTDVHRAAGGRGLQVDTLRLFDTADVSVGVPQ